MSIPDSASLRLLRDAATSDDVVSQGLRRTTSVHEFYRYPARFSPAFARAVLTAFSRPGDLVLDPFVGGGTTLVEARLLGRPAIGADLNSLAVFISRAKTTVHSPRSLREVNQWADELAKTLSVNRRVNLPDEWADRGYLRHLSSAHTWRIRNLVAQSIHHLDTLTLAASRRLARCAILRAAQWALDMKTETPRAAQFRHRLILSTRAMADVAEDYSAAVRQMDLAFPFEGQRTRIINRGLPELAGLPSMHEVRPRLILTSPPYPGVYVNYHRWKIGARKETPAPYWVAACWDGHGLAHYTLSARADASQDLYFKRMAETWKGLVDLAERGTWIVQAVGFSSPRQLERYLAVLYDVGLDELRFSEMATAPDGRLWRSVPGRRWWVRAGDRATSAPHTSSEVVLVHRKGRD